MPAEPQRFGLRALRAWAALKKLARRTISDRLPHDDWIVIGWAIALKIFLFLFAAKTFQVLNDKRVGGVRAALELWNRWDSLHHQRLARFGYNELVAVKAWPLYAWCVRFVAIFDGKDYLVAAILVSGLALIVAAILLRRLVALEYSDAVALRAVWFLLIFPTAYVLHISYTESLFLALAIGCIFAARTNRWPLAGVLGALACMTRANGFVLLPTLLVEAGHEFFTTRKWQRRWLWIAVVPLGFGVFLLLNRHTTGDAFAFLHKRQQLSAVTTSWPWVSIREAYLNMRRSPGQAEMVGAQEMEFALFGLVCCIASWIKLRPVYAAWNTGNWLGFTCATYLSSVPRYTLTMFPIFILFALLARNRFWFGLITFCSLCAFAFFASLFVRGWWAF